MSPAAPAGESVRSDPEFEQLEAEIDKLRSAPATVDWGAVIALSRSLLKSRTKDFRIASYLTVGLVHTAGFEGLLDGLLCYEALLNTFWDNGYPEAGRKGRANAVDWLFERLGSELSRRDVRGAEDDLILELEGVAGRFVEQVAGRFEGERAGETEMLAAVRSRADAVRARRAAEEQAREAQRLAAEAPPGIRDREGADRVLEECRSKLAEVAAFLFKADPTDPLSYRLLRGSTWGWLMTPPSHDNLTTFVPAPERGPLERCESLGAQQEWQSVLEECETGFAERVLALDLQRHCAAAMKALGAPYAAAREAVLEDLAGVVGRFPELLRMKFSDGTPLADAATKMWIEGEVLASAAKSRSGGEGGDPAGGPEAAGLGEAAAEARRLVGDGKLKEAFQLLREGLARSGSRRARFLWRLELARLCADVERHQLALPQLQLLDEEIGRHSLEDWDPSLAIEVLRLLFRCRQRQTADTPERGAEAQRELETLYGRICRLDVDSALTLEE